MALLGMAMEMDVISPGPKLSRCFLFACFASSPYEDELVALLHAFLRLGPKVAEWLVCVTCLQAAITETPNIGASTPVTPQALPVRPVRVDPASGSTVSPAPLSDSDQGSHGPPSATSVPGETEECKTPRPVPAAQPPQDRHSEAPVGESALSSSKSSKTPHFGVASHGHGAPMWPRPHMGSSPPDRPPPPTAMAAAAAGMPYLPGGWYVPPGAPPSPQIGAVMPGGIPSNGQMMPQMMPQQPWQQLYQQQMAQQLWQQQQQQQYMQYYYNQPPTTSMYPAMQMQPPSMMPMPGGMVPGMDMHEMHVDNLRVSALCPSPAPRPIIIFYALWS